MSIAESYQKAADPSNAKLFKNVGVRLGTMLLRGQAEGFLEGFTSETKGGTGRKSRHAVFEIRAADFSARKDKDTKLKDCDFSIYLSAEKTGPVTIAFYPVGHKARNMLEKIMGKDRINVAKGPHQIGDTSSQEFKMLLEILAGVMSRAGQNFHRKARNDPAP